MANGYTVGGNPAPFGSQHADDGLPRLPSTRLPGAGDEAAMADYIAGKQTGGGHPIGGADPEAGKMARHGVRAVKRELGKAARHPKKVY